MKKLLSVSLCLLFAASMAAQTGKIRVATVGNSITGGTNDYGYYAMPLAEMLGDDYEVTKFGKGFFDACGKFAVSFIQLYQNW